MPAGAGAGAGDFSVFQNIHIGCRGHKMGTGGFSWGQSGRGVTLTTHRHLMSTLRMSGVTRLLPLCAFLVWTRKDLIFFAFI
jgi:hypothetical protein